MHRSWVIYGLSMCNRQKYIYLQKCKGKITQNQYCHLVF